MRGVAFILCLQLATSACAHVDAHPRTSGPHENSREPHAVTSSDSGTSALLDRDIADRFPGADILDEAEFADAIVGRLFRYREIVSGIVVNRPKEVFLDNGMYRVHGRVIARGSWSITGEIVSVEGPSSFLGLRNRRIFFRHDGRLLTTSVAGDGDIYELIPES